MARNNIARGLWVESQPRAHVGASLSRHPAPGWHETQFASLVRWGCGMTRRARAQLCSPQRPRRAGLSGGCLGPQDQEPCFLFLTCLEVAADGGPFQLLIKNFFLVETPQLFFYLIFGPGGGMDRQKLDTWG